ncbi:hypothetical protein DL766_000735 [Monosporascus sp. MC13-8B]|nr:hypothetical protein DL763_002572 [Monosporascus cannonballus]RYP38926.1 hypothetical protein DL766_000735 [Monosporascus sp. MC13-8B]
MARLTQVPIAPGRSGAPSPDALAELNRLLARLQQSIIHADAERERRLRTSEYERNKVGTNLEYARSLLTRLEQDALAIKVHARRQEAQADLNRKRDVFEQLTERLRELEDISIDTDDDSSEGEDLLGGGTIQTPSESLDSRSADNAPEDRREDGWEGGGEREAADKRTVVAEQSTRSDTAPRSIDPPVQTQSPPSTIPPEPQAAETTTTSQNLRTRGAASASQPAATTAAGTTSARRELFGDRKAPATTATTEAILDHHRAEQDRLTESLVRMATALKQSSRAFATSLEDERAVLDAAGEGLARGETSLEATTRRMGALRRMSEGRGWWGRMMLYAWIFGLAVLAVLIVFVLPKLRF